MEKNGSQGIKRFALCDSPAVGVLQTDEGRIGHYQGSGRLSDCGSRQENSICGGHENAEVEKMEGKISPAVESCRGNATTTLVTSSDVPIDKGFGPEPEYLTPYDLTQEEIEQANQFIYKCLDKIEIPNQLREQGFIRIKLLQKEPEDFWRDPKNIYSFNNKVLKAWLDGHKNYGVPTGFNGLIVVDIDVPERATELGIFDKLPSTFTVRTRSGGFHYYYRCSELTSKLVMVDKEFKDEKGNPLHIGEVQAQGQYVIGPGSLFHLCDKKEKKNPLYVRNEQGQIEPVIQKWEVENPSEIMEISKKTLLEILNCFSFGQDKDKPSPKVRKTEKIEQSQKEKTFPDTRQYIKIEDILMPDNIQKDDRNGSGEIQGSHPIHGSDNGKNFSINVKKNNWICYRCIPPEGKGEHCGGGAWELLGVREGILSCDDCYTGWRKDKPEKWAAILEKAKELGLAVPPIGKSSSEKWIVQENRICESKTVKTKDGDLKILEPLCSFTAQIKEEITLDNGEEKTKAFSIEGVTEIGRNLQALQVKAEDYESMKWILPGWGISANIFPKKKDDVRSAIQYLSPERGQKTIYTYTGWREIDGEMVYLHAGGAISKDGPVKDIGVQLPDRLVNYVLPDVKPEEIEKAVRASLKILEIDEDPHSLTMPMLALVGLAPLGEMLSIDFTFWMTGISGCYKSALAALIQAHWGSKWTGIYMPENWESTANHIEAMAHAVKDAVFGVDDFHPVGGATQTQKMVAVASRVIRAQANKAGRGRMKADTSTTTGKYPRGLLLVTGEDNGIGSSEEARVFPLEVEKGMTNTARLTEVQELAADGWLAKSMSAYLTWIAAHWNELKTYLPARHASLRAEIQASTGGHARLPDMTAKLLVGWETWLRFAKEMGALTSAQEAEYVTYGLKNLTNAAQNHNDMQKSQDYGLRFLELMNSAFIAGHVHLRSLETGKQPLTPTRWGWVDGNTIIHSDGSKYEEWHPKGAMIGWVDKEGDVYLEGTAAYMELDKIARMTGGSIGITEKTLWKRLDEKHLLIKTDGKGNKFRASIPGIGRKNVIRLLNNAMEVMELEVDGEEAEASLSQA